MLKYLTPKTVIVAATLVALLLPGPAPAQAAAEKRIALVVGNAGYQTGALKTPANDAGLIAQTLQAAGFDVTGARDLDQVSLRQALRDFLDKAQGSGPDTVAVIYLAGYGLQLEGENYFAPVDARIARDTDVPLEAVRVSDYTRGLAALKLKASIIILDAARAHPFAKAGQPLAGGLALVEAEPGSLIAFSAAPGTVAPESQGDYGPYAQALAEMMREGGLPIADVFDRTRLRVNELTRGAQVPWQSSKIEKPFMLFERAPDAPPPAVSPDQTASMRTRPMRDFSAQDAYVAALERDTLEGYLDFMGAYPDDPMAARVRAIIAARREAITWRRTRFADTPPAYWSYLRRYPRGPHSYDARRRLAFLTAALEPPPSFALFAYDVPPPPPDEIIYVDRPVLMFDDPGFGFAPPPPPPVMFLPPPPPEFIMLPPPPPQIALYVLPMPAYRPVPLWVRPPSYIAPPPANNVIYSNVHNSVVINNTTNQVTVTNPAGQVIAPPALPPNARSGTAPVAAIGPALPPSVARRALTIPAQAPGTPPPGTSAPGTSPVPPSLGAPGTTTGRPPTGPTGQRGRALPGTAGQPLPSITPPPGTKLGTSPPAGTTVPNARGGTPRGATPGPSAPSLQAPSTLPSTTPQSTTPLTPSTSLPAGGARNTLPNAGRGTPGLVPSTGPGATTPSNVPGVAPPKPPAASIKPPPSITRDTAPPRTMAAPPPRIVQPPPQPRLVAPPSPPLQPRVVQPPPQPRVVAPPPPRIAPPPPPPAAAAPRPAPAATVKPPPGKPACGGPNQPPCPPR